jgi:hypothetical protein
LDIASAKAGENVDKVICGSVSEIIRILIMVQADPEIKTETVVSDTRKEGLFERLK